jgi:uncharacterized pyridoxamine 5'-phosphate oxidase family protein
MVKCLDRSRHMKGGPNKETLPNTVIKGNAPLKDRLEKLGRSEMSAVLATESGGQPYTSIIAFALAPGLKGLVFATPKATSKYRNIVRNPHVSVLIDNRSRARKDIMRGEAVTILGTARPVRRGKRWMELASALTEKNPGLADFVNAPTTALIYVEAARYIHVGRFQTVTVSDAF